MGRIAIPPRALLFLGILHSPSVEVARLTQHMENCFGTIVLASEPFIFTETEYYRKEMGQGLSRIWLGFNCFIEPDRLVEIKLRCNSIETERYSISGSRKVNLDPGYVTLGKVVLASTKNNQHRLYLGRGIYGEVTLRFRKKRFEPWEWTFADYRREEAVQFFIQFRNYLKNRLQKP